MHKLKSYSLAGDPEHAWLTYWDGHRYQTLEIQAGGLTDVSVDVFREQGFTYVLSWNERHPYIGLEKFLGCEAKGNVFLHKYETIEKVFGKSGFDLTPSTMARKMLRHFEEQIRRGSESR